MSQTNNDMIRSAQKSLRVAPGAKPKGDPWVWAPEAWKASQAPPGPEGPGDPQNGPILGVPDPISKTDFCQKRPKRG